MNEPDYNWLALPPEGRKQKLFPRTEKREQLAVLLRQLDWEQRLWLRALMKNSFSVRAARKDLKTNGLRAPEPYKVSRWGNIEVFSKARELYADMLYDGEAPTKSTILLRINKIAEYNAEEVDEFWQGAPTGRTAMRDGSLALKANEMLGKQHDLFADKKDSTREGPAFIVQIISKEDPTRVIDVTPGRVQVKPLEQDDIIDAEPADGP